jgi:hypothetical protein
MRRIGQWACFRLVHPAGFAGNHLSGIPNKPRVLIASVLEPDYFTERKNVVTIELTLDIEQISR